MKISPKLIVCARWLSLLTAGALTLLAIFVAEENWRGDRAWAAYERELKARGESVDLATFASPPVPDHLNFFKEPLLERLFYKNDSAVRQKLIAEFTLGSYFPKKLPPDFVEVRDVLKRRGLFAGPDSDQPAIDVLTAMRRFDPLFDALRDAALHRPASALNIGGSPIELPDARSVLRAGRTLALRAHAALAVGDTPTGYLDTFTLLRLSQSLTATPRPVIILLMANSLETLAAGIIQEGCERRIWNDSQLAEFQRFLFPADPLGWYAKAVRVERAGYLYFLDAEPRPAEFDPFPFWVFHGWVQQNKIRYSKIFDTEILPAFSEDPDRNFPARLEKLREMAKRRKTSSSPFEILRRGALLNFGSLWESYSGATLQALHVATLCALERYRLARGAWPESLEDLVSVYLPAVPTDFFIGQPVGYERLPEGGIQLTSASCEGRLTLVVRDAK